jgi:hypothetical protein
MCDCGKNKKGCCKRVIVTERGLQGPRGEQGPPGEQGPQGEQGTPGTNGVDGECTCNIIEKYEGIRASETSPGENEFNILPEFTYTVPAGVTDATYKLEISAEAFFNEDVNQIAANFKKSAVLIQNTRTVAVGDSSNVRVIPFHLMVTTMASTSDVLTFEVSSTAPVDAYLRAFNFVLTRIS